MSTIKNTADTKKQDNVRDKSKKCINCNLYYGQEQQKCPQCDMPLTLINNDLTEGTVIGEKYEIEALVGDGGMGKIYRASHKLMKRKVAIKMLHSGLVGQSATLTRFKKEAEASSQLDHTNIVTTFDFGLTPDGRPYLVMDFLDGISLSDLLTKEKVLEPRRCLDLFIQLCAGFEHAHTKGIIHRDIKPSNIFIVKDEKQNEIIKILDFGIAKRIKDSRPDNNNEETDLTIAGTVFGSPLYMSPEQARGGEIDYRSDIYSLSCLLYQCLTGTPPYQSDNSMDCMYSHLNKEPEPFNMRCPAAQIPDSLQNIVFKGLNKEPEERIESMEEYEKLLRHELTELISKEQNSDSNEEAVAGGDSREETLKKDKEDRADRWLSWATPLGAIFFLTVATSLSDVKVFDASEVDKIDAPPVVKKVSNSNKMTVREIKTKNSSSNESKEAQKENEIPDRKPLQLPLGKTEKNKSLETKRLEKLMTEGKVSYNSGDYLRAQNLFIDASRLAGEIDKNSTEYIESVNWLGKTLLARKKYRHSIIYLRWAANKLDSALGKDSEIAQKARADLNLALAKVKQ